MISRLLTACESIHPHKRSNMTLRSRRLCNLAVLVATLFRTSAAVATDEWRYIVPMQGEADEYPPLRALALQATKPEDLTETASYRGTRRQYAQIRFGNATSVRVAAVLDRVSSAEFDLYLDANRDRTITESERLTSKDRDWRVQLDMAVADDDGNRLIGRQVLFRLGKTGRIFSYATLGYLEGSIEVDGQQIPVRRQDGDGNGLVNDPQDRLWLDFNRDGDRDPLTEQFLFGAILKRGDRRYSVASDRLGNTLKLKPLEGTGVLRLSFAPAADGAQIQEITATLNGRDGSAVSLSGDLAEEIVPAGEYRLGSVSVVLSDPAGGESWGYVFDENGGRVADNEGRLVRHWYKVEQGQTVSLDPLGKLVMEVDCNPGETRQPGEEVRVQPLLYTAEGLLITTCFRGRQSDYCESSASVSLRAPDGRPIATARSGFA